MKEIKPYKWAIQSPFWYGEPYGEKIPTYEEFTKDWKRYYFDGSKPEKGRSFTIIIGNKSIGEINYNEINREDNSAELDILIYEEAEKGKGYGPDALRTLTKYLFSKMDVQLCWIEAVTKNIRAIRAYEKAGFKTVRTFVKDSIGCVRMELKTPALLRDTYFKKDYLASRTLNWLLEEDSPSVCYFTLMNVLDRQKDDKVVIQARRAIMEHDTVQKILSHQNPDGGFLSPAIISKYGKARARTGYQPKYKGTIWQAIFLAQLGADKNDERVKKLGNFILGANYHPNHKVFGIYLQRKYSLDFVAMPCFVSNMVWSLSRLGFYEDERVQASIKWLLKYQRFDDGGFKTPKQWPYRGNRDRCFGKHSCFSGCTKALKAMTIIPEEDRNQEIKDFIKKAIDFILLHNIYKRSRGNGRPIRKEYGLLTFPLTYYDDVLGILESLLFFNVQDKSIDDAIKFVLAKRNKNGRWVLEKTINPSSMYLSIEKRDRESKWITYRVLNVLKKYAELNG